MVEQLAVDPLSRVFAALADPTRRDMIAHLTECDATVTELASRYPVSLQAVSKHVQVLEGAGLVRRSRSGRERPVHLDADVLSLMDAWLERYRRRAEERFGRLDDVLATLDLDDRASTTTDTTTTEGAAS